MDLKGDCATIGLVRVDEKDKKTPLTMDLKGKLFFLRYSYSHCNAACITTTLVQMRTKSKDSGTM